MKKLKMKINDLVEACLRSIKEKNKPKFLVCDNGINICSLTYIDTKPTNKDISRLRIKIRCPYLTNIYYKSLSKNCFYLTCEYKEGDKNEETR